MSVGPRRFKVAHDHPLAAEHALLQSYLRQAFELEPGYYREVPLKDTEAGSAIVASKPEFLCGLVMAAKERIADMDEAFREVCARGFGYHTDDSLYKTRAALFSVQRATLRRKLPFDAAGVEALLSWMDDAVAADADFYMFPAAGVIKALKDYTSRNEYDARFGRPIGRIAKNVAKHPDRERQKMGERLLEIAGRAPRLRVQPGEAWSDAVIGYAEALREKEQAPLCALLNHCAAAAGGRPAKKWSAAADELIAAVDEETFFESVAEWFELVDRPRTQVIETWSEWMPNPNLMIQDGNADVLKGLAWLCGLRTRADTAHAIEKLALSAYRKVPGVGPRATKVGNACVWALGRIPGDSALAALAILKVRVKFRPAQKGIASALAAAAERAGMTPEELEEIGVPDYGMEEVGLRTATLGDYVANLRVVNAKKTELVWINPAGKTIKTVPKIVREQHADALKALRDAGKDILKMLSAQRDRLDGLFLSQRVWHHADWRRRYVDHPLVGTLGRRLIWSFQTAQGSRSGIWSGDRLVASDGTALDGLEDDTEVRLWHPAGAERDEVLAWRAWLESREISQPFKQAHREIYLLTDAERNTGVYSNRFASHIVKQHQFNALCAARGWRHSLRLMVDDEYEPPTKELAQWGLRAEFWVEGVGEDYGTDTTESGSYLYLATDQVRFYAIDAARNSAHAGGGGYASHGRELAANAPLPLNEIDPLVLSEVLRDVDLFVGVASVGNDPNWSDGGPEGRYVDYWSSYSFGELSESARTRRDLLERLIPRLKIGDRCSLEERYLRVDGDIRTYRIHLGSGNVLMEPNDEYLCIVAAQGSARQAAGVFLPFEGDNRMALILSKAFLLAEDRKITDATIVSQIKP